MIGLIIYSDNGCFENLSDNGCFENLSDNGCFENLSDNGCFENLSDNGCFENSFLIMVVLIIPFQTGVNMALWEKKKSHFDSKFSLAVTSCLENLLPLPTEPRGSRAGSPYDPEECQYSSSSPIYKAVKFRDDENCWDDDVSFKLV
ncbi:hypothetical protein NPIL_590701 [Nephila pilipes]|uniref:Uncharacterized protein n=1 Tax=Nephila pilipes TaxID=299642 RepID=A0A8X6PQR4_NEPPI|nr:hypothetical protein NPIL_52311 [Nephila pilipes]GFT78687.1 hypothetical protein NPIL_590701 [Nephila pilipes]